MLLQELSTSLLICLLFGGALEASSRARFAACFCDITVSQKEANASQFSGAANILPTTVGRFSSPPITFTRARRSVAYAGHSFSVC